jgi:DNA-binding transcriptional regulator YdaS (Cro superfamily)
MAEPAAPTPAEALRHAVDRIGSQSAMSRLLGVTQPAVSGWLKESKHLPAEHVLKVEEATGISRHALRPDLYPDPNHPAPQPDLPVRAPAGRTDEPDRLAAPGSSIAGRAPVPDRNRRPVSQLGPAVR